MKARANYIVIALTALTVADAVWLDVRSVLLMLAAYGLHRARPIIMDWFDA